MNVFPFWEFGARCKRVVVADRRLNMENMGHVHIVRLGQPEALDGGEGVQAVFGALSDVG